MVRRKKILRNGLKINYYEKEFWGKALTYPQPVFIIAAYDENGTPNAMNAAWGGISEMHEISICISEDIKRLPIY